MLAWFISLVDYRLAGGRLRTYDVFLVRHGPVQCTPASSQYEWRFIAAPRNETKGRLELLRVLNGLCVGIARVLIMQPQVLLMDEPFGSLDAQTRSLMQELLLQVWERHHQTVLFITHDIEEALLLADRVCVMTVRPGRVKKSIEVNIPRPRAIEVTTSQEFKALRREVLSLIREKSQRAAAEAPV